MAEDGKETRKEEPVAGLAPALAARPKVGYEAREYWCMLWSLAQLACTWFVSASEKAAAILYEHRGTAVAILMWIMVLLLLGATTEHDRHDVIRRQTDVYARVDDFYGLAVQRFDQTTYGIQDIHDRLSTLHDAIYLLGIVGLTFVGVASVVAMVLCTWLILQFLKMMEVVRVMGQYTQVVDAQLEKLLEIKKE